MISTEMRGMRPAAVVIIHRGMGAMKEGVMGFSKGLPIRGVRGRVLWLALAVAATD